MRSSSVSSAEPVACCLDRLRRQLPPLQRLSILCIHREQSLGVCCQFAVLVQGHPALRPSPQGVAFNIQVHRSLAFTALDCSFELIGGGVEAPLLKELPSFLN